jgi:lipoyl(octanoyl) transferase
LNFLDLGVISYKNALDVQLKLFENAINQKINTQKLEKNTLSQNTIQNNILLCEHTPVFTLGKSGNMENLWLSETLLKEKNIEFFKTDRGGDITFHGFGQLVVYPILDLEQFDMSLRIYIEKLEEIIIQLLKKYDIQAQRQPNASGVWVNEYEKICALGVRSSRHVTMHGLALNINTDLSYFDYINPCGLTGKSVTSIAQKSKNSPTFLQVKDDFCAIFKEIFKP